MNVGTSVDTENINFMYQIFRNRRACNDLERFDKINISKRGPNMYQCYVTSTCVYTLHTCKCTSISRILYIYKEWIKDERTDTCIWIYTHMRVRNAVSRLLLNHSSKAVSVWEQKRKYQSPPLRVQCLCCNHGMAGPRMCGWKMAENALNDQSWTADKGCLSGLVDGSSARNLHSKVCDRNVYKDLSVENILLRTLF
jgi:hypothetical protein